MDNPFSRLLHFIVLMFFMVLLLPVAILVFIAMGFVTFGVDMLLGSPGGPVGSALGIGWFGGSLALIFGICVLAYRRIPFIRRIAHTEEKVNEMLFGSASDAPAKPARDPQADATTFYSRVGASDARLAESPTEDASPDASESA